MARTNHGSIRRLLKVAVLASIGASSLTMAGPLDSVPTGRWYQFPSSRMDAVQPSPLPAGYIQAVMVAWSGGVYDTDRERLVVWGGGHGDYAGNEVYAFGPLTSDTPRWERLTDPSNPVANNVIRASDGRPVSRHTYNLLTYLPAPHNKMMSCAVGSQYSNGFGNGGVDFYDFTINGKTGQPWSAGPTAPSNAYPYNSYCVYNPSTQSVFYQDVGSNGSALQEYKLSTQSWTKHVTYDPNSSPTAVVDTKRNLIISTGVNHGLQVYDPANPKALPIRVASTGPKNIEGAPFPGFVYDSANDQFVGWNGGSTLYTLKAPTDPKTGTWVWSQLALDSGNAVTPTAPAGVRISGYIIGTFGRFRYVPSQKGVIVVNSTDESVYFFKLGGGSTTPTQPLPSINLSASPTSVASQGTSTLTWSTTNATSCSASGAWTGTKGTSGSEARGPLNANSTFTLSCTGAGGTANQSVTVNVAAAVPAPTVDLNANPASVPAGGATSLSWTSSNASTCSASAGWTGAKSVSGSENLAAVNQQTTYTLTCTGTGGTTSDSVTVTMSAPATPAPVVSLQASPASVTAGSSTDLTWSATNATGCTASGGWAGTKAASGVQTIGPVNANTNYVLTCNGAGGSGSKTVTVSVTSPTTPAPSGGGPLASVPAARWYQFANSRMDAVAPSPLPPGYIAAVMLAWSGGVYDSDRDRMVVWGGGGSDYGGNEVYAFGPLTSDTPRWERLTDPSTPQANALRGSDGRPVSRHTYSLLTYLPAPHNKMMSCAVGGQYSNGYGVGGVDFYDFTINGKTGQPWSAGPTAPSNAYPYNSYCIYNPGTQSVFYQDNGSNSANLQEYKLSTGTWTKHVQYDPGSEPTAAVDTKRNLIVTTGQYHGVQIYDPANPSALPIRVATSGPKFAEDGRFPGFIYDPVNDQFIGWNGGSALYALKAPADVRNGTWVWSQIALDAGNTVTPTAVAGVRHAGYAIGTYGRFRYVPSLGGVVLVNAVDENVFFFKLPGSSAPAPSITLSASPTTVAAQGSSTLSWSASNATSCTASGAWTGAKAVSGSEARGPLSASSTFTLSCTGAGGTANKSVTVSIAPAPTVDLTATPTSVSAGSTTSLAWTSANATSCTASGGWSGTKSTSGSQSSAALSQQTTFTLTCSGAGGQASDSVTVSTTVPAPTVSFQASPASIQSGGRTDLIWSSTNATSCTASGGWTGSKATSGAKTVGPLSASTNYVLTCTGAGGSKSASTTVTVASAPPPNPTTPAPTVSLQASPASILVGRNTDLIWSSTNATACTASGGWTGTQATSGAKTVGPVNANTNYVLTCTGAGGSTNASTTVSVVPAPTLTFSATPTTVTAGTATAVTWSSANATSCTASGAWSGSKSTSGNQSVTLSQSGTLTLTCNNAVAQVSKDVAITVQAPAPAPTLTFSATPTTVTAGNATAVTWSSANATSCTASGAWSGSKGTSGTESVTLSQSGTLSLTCNSSTAQVSKDVAITVTAAVPPPASGNLANDGPATPEQISIFIPSSLPFTATATTRYRQVGVSAWTIGHALHRIRPDFSDTPTPAGGFAWVITDLTPGTAYEVEVTIVNGTETTVHSGVITTRALPAPAGSANKIIAAGSTASQVQTVFNNANAGDVIQFANGVYTVDNLQLNRSGTAASPIYIRGESRTGAILRDPNGAIVRLLAASNIVLENLTLEGAKVDSGTNAGSVGINFFDGVAPTQMNVTIRNITVDGVDQGITGDSDLRQILVYDNVFRGNNQWNQDFYAYGGGGTPGAGDGVLDLEQNIFWNDDGVRLPGFGHAVFNNTFTGFGDTLAVCSHSGGSATANCATSHFYRNDIRMTGDDAIEVDYGIRNITFYDNRIHNSATFISLDPLFGGPFIASRNISINTTRGPFKFNSPNSGHFIYNNTIVRTTGTYGVAGETSAEAGWYQANNGPQRGFGYQNNLFIYRGTGTQTIRLDNPGYSNLDFSNNSWYPNAVFQWPENRYANLATALSSLPATTPVFSNFTKRHQNDNISEIDPFATDITLGANYRTQVTTLYTPILTPGSAPTGNGVAIANVTDGFSGAAPDRGAIITGRPLPKWGDRSTP